MSALHVLSGGAAQGLVGKLASAVRERTGLAVEGQFGAVGLMQDKLRAGAPCDVLILSQALITGLESSGEVLVGSARPLGGVATGVAVPEGEALLQAETREALAEALRQASGIYFPDPIKATAGIHFMKVLHALGLAETLASRLRPHPNGNAAMRAMAADAAAGQRGLIGCTQVTEILYTPGVCLAGLLPAGLDLVTTYTAAVAARSQRVEAARTLVALLAGPEAATARRDSGFQP